ncbi:g2/mitotic-specific cyclin-B3-like [Planoprotostelium fungivorum]|uniref:G2/mitotic-specific cyclin-B3-like n=1 Tax=Planoprotostelium fungivorum TaxID=1890364 RepID=A0A2P6N3V8_9EUKA|nr:g2/mitotic-specific cyclin-B3-like [Planoprotostelium fungivorum]PRP79426.1 g2/mitotic-specific cyclin-B3-like [Planoprotostelium fungivorum]
MDHFYSSHARFNFIFTSSDREQATVPTESTPTALMTSNPIIRNPSRKASRITKPADFKGFTIFQEKSTNAERATHKRSPLKDITNARVTKKQKTNTVDENKLPSTVHKAPRLQPRPTQSHETTHARPPLKTVVPQKPTAVKRPTTLPKSSISSSAASHVPPPKKFNHPSALLRHPGRPRPHHVSDIDRDATMDSFISSEYAADIQLYLLEKELACPFDREALCLKPAHRAIMIGWIQELSEAHGVVSDVTHLAVQILDHYLSRVRTNMTDYQLITATSFIIANKVEGKESWRLSYPDVVDLCLDCNYTIPLFLKAERVILSTLDYAIDLPTAVSFVRRFIFAAGLCSLEYRTVKFVLDVTLPDLSMTAHLPSTRAAAAVYLVLERAGKEWDADAEYHTGYSEVDLQPAVSDLSAALKRATVNERKRKSHPEECQFLNL